MVRPPSRRRLTWLLAFAALSGCVEGSGGFGTTPPPTRIGVDPADFLGDVPCANAPGALRTYQVVLTDVTPDLPGGDGTQFELPASSVLSCNQQVTFDFVVPGHSYIASVSAFDRDDLSAQAPGVARAVDDDGTVVPPRWTTTCFGTPAALAAQTEGNGSLGAGGAGGAGLGGVGNAGAGGETSGAGEVELGAVAVEDTTIFVRGCAELVDAGPETPTGVTVSLEDALVGLSCGNGSGQVATFTATVQVPGSAPLSETTSCGDTLSFEGLPAGANVSVAVRAFAAGASSPGWTTACAGRTRPGASVPVSCDPLTPTP